MNCLCFSFDVRRSMFSVTRRPQSGSTIDMTTFSLSLSRRTRRGNYGSHPRLAAAGRAAAVVTDAVVVQAPADPLFQQVHDQVVDPQRLRDVILRAGEVRRRLGRE